MATIVNLPGAAAAPVRQEGRRGPHPRTVTSMHRYKNLKAIAAMKADRARAEAAAQEVVETRADLVAGLTTLLRFAIAGELTGFVMSAHRRGGHDILSAGSYQADHMLAIAAATRMQQRFCTLADEDEDEEA